MIEYSVVLKRWKGSSKPDVYIYSDEDREKAIAKMGQYVRNEGFSVRDYDGRHTVSGVHLVAKERVVGAPIVSDLEYLQIFDELGNRRPGS